MWVNVNILHCLHGFVGFVLALVENIERHPMPKWLLFTPLTNKRKLWDIGVTKGDNTCSWKKVQVVHKREQNNRKNYIYLLGTQADEFIYSLTLTMVELSMFLEKCLRKHVSQTMFLATCFLTHVSWNVFLETGFWRHVSWNLWLATCFFQHDS